MQQIERKRYEVVPVQVHRYRYKNKNASSSSRTAGIFSREIVDWPFDRSAVAAQPFVIISQE